MKEIILIAASYLFGSVPFGLIIAKMHGKNLRAIGSGNIGATNLSRAVGRKWGIACFVLDFLKGLIPMLAAKHFIVPAVPAAVHLLLWLAVGTAAVIGHILPVYVAFKGGKGVATSLGMVVGLWPFYAIPGLVCFVVWLIVLFTWRYMSLASVAGAVVFPAVLTTFIALIPDWHFSRLWPLLLAAVLIAGLIVFLHRSNIKRLLAGTESKILTGKKITAA
ncbi:MAG: glycerol-3-phosphate 1-O-acyltransferase PlsY [Planctomycetota bacterium]